VEVSPPLFYLSQLTYLTSPQYSRKHVYEDLQPYKCLEISCSYSRSTFADKRQWIQHLALEHAFNPEWKSIPCPLCKEETGDGKIEITQHLANHLEEISLGALPRMAESETASVFSNFDAAEEQGHSFPGDDTLKVDPIMSEKGNEKADDTNTTDPPFEAAPGYPVKWGHATN
jgi:hypothetical protein